MVEHDARVPRRRSALLISLTLALVVMLPAVVAFAAASGSYAGGEGAQTHVGRPLHGPDDDRDACGEFHTYDAALTFALGSGSVTIDGETYDGSIEVAHDDAGAGPWHEGPDGTYPDDDCLLADVGHEVDGFAVTVQSTGDGGESFSCQPSRDGSSTGWYRRGANSDPAQVEFEYREYSCQVNDGAGSTNNATLEFEHHIVQEAGVTACNFPITPTACAITDGTMDLHNPTTGPPPRTH